MKRVSGKRIRDTAAQLCIEANYQLPEEVIQALRRVRRRKENEG